VYTLPLAKIFGGANQAAYSWKRICLDEGLVSAFEVLGPNPPDKLRDVDSGRTAKDARRLITAQAAVSFSDRSPRFIEVHMVPGVQA
jgi:hypothetical protein